MTPSADDTQPCQPPTLPSFDELQGLQDGWTIDLDAEWLDDDDAVDIG